MAAAAEPSAAAVVQEEFLDVLTNTGQKTGVSKPRGQVHRDGDYHRAVHVWIYAESTRQLLLQRRADCKDSWPGLWDISSAGHISAGDSSLLSARRELQEELGIRLPEDAFELLFVFVQECVINDGTYINNEFNDVYLVTTLDPIPLEAFTLQETEVSSVRYISLEEYKDCLVKEDKEYVPYDLSGQYGRLFDILTQRYLEEEKQRSLALQKQLSRYAPIHLHTEVWSSNLALREWLKEHSEHSSLDKLKWMYFTINKSPWSCLDENKAFLTTADSVVKLCTEATKAVSGWNGLQYKAAFPPTKPPGANFYPPDMDKMEFTLWTKSLNEDDRKAATGYFNVIRRRSGFNSDNVSSHTTEFPDIVMVPFSQEYRSLLDKAAALLHKAAETTDSPRTQSWMLRLDLMRHMKIHFLVTRRHLKRSLE